MNIKKIIREEMDDFNWIRDTYIPNTIDFFIPGNCYYMDRLFKESTDSVECYEFSHYNQNLQAITYDDGRGLLKFNGSCGDFTPLFIETKLKENGLTLYDLDPTTSYLKESEKNTDLQWIEDLTPNPWLHYNYILIDEEPSRENIEYLVDQALTSGMVSQSCIDSWNRTYALEISTIMCYEKAYLRIDNFTKWLFYGCGDSYIIGPGDIVTNYSELFKN